jgi:hypothetical protein
MWIAKCHCFTALFDEYKEHLGVLVIGNINAEFVPKVHEKAVFLTSACQLVKRCWSETVSIRVTQKLYWTLTFNPMLHV